MRNHIFVVLFSFAVILFGISFINQNYSHKMHRQVRKVENALHKREKMADHYARLAIDYESNWVGFDKMPEDMVLYRYKADTLQSWIHQFPINNDETQVYPFSYHLQYLSNRNVYSKPLAYIGDGENFVNLGSAWYVVNTHRSNDGRIKVITGIKVMTEYPTSNIPDKVNPKLKMGKGIRAVSLNNDASSVVRSRSGEPLFSLITEAPESFEYGNLTLRWFALILLVFTVFPFHYLKRTWKSFWVAIITLAIVRLFAYLLVAQGIDVGDIFSPMLYADSLLMDSLGSLVINNVSIALVIYSIFLMRRDIYARAEGWSRKKRNIVISLIIALGLSLICYIHFIIHSLTVNSNIVFEVYRLEQMSGYSLLCYLNFAMLFLALLFIIQMCLSFIKGDSAANLFSWGYIISFVALISIFTVTTLSVYGLEKEYEINRVRTSKLAIERDLALEIYLRSVEQDIAQDRFIPVLSSVGAIDLVRNRLLERYFYNDLFARYNVKLTICGNEDYLNVGGMSAEPVSCHMFYEDMAKDYGVMLAPDSPFMYLNNYNGLASYLGVFTYVTDDYKVLRLFFEIESKLKTDVISNPFDVFNSRTSRSASIPRLYSYARYSNGRLVTNGGDYTYPVSPVTNYKLGYMMGNKNGYVHFINCISDEDMTVISRPRRPFFPYVVSFSYLFIFYGLFILTCTAGRRTNKLIILPRYSIKRKITVLITVTMVGSLLCMGIGSVVYVMRLNSSRNRELMEEKIYAVQNTLSKHCKYALRYNDISTPELFAGMEEASKLLQTDVNLYDIHGSLIHTTNPEVFEQFIVGKRINNKAYEDVIFNNSPRYITVEEIAGINYYSVYAPLFNEAGEMVAIVNIPYFDNNEDVRTANFSAISTIINIYLILLLAAVTIAAILANSFARPLAEIKSKIDHLALSGGNKHIKYKNLNDELGVLIQSYNKMVDDLAESSRQLARSEREQAWKEMSRQIAHEIKNPLTPMRLSIQYLMRMKEQNVPGWEEKMDKVSKSLLEQIDSLSETANEFSSFARFFSEDETDVNLNELIQDELVLFDNRENIHIRLVSSCSPSVVWARRNPLSRVFVNLVTNSIQAIENASIGNGDIEIHLDAVKLDDHDAFRVTVEDNGPGVSEENLGKLFTPNFTTKSGGTGLGLAICRSIIEQSGGTISYSKSEALGGACFTILLLAKEDL